MTRVRVGALGSGVELVLGFGLGLGLGLGRGLGLEVGATVMWLEVMA